MLLDVPVNGSNQFETYSKKLCLFICFAAVSLPVTAKDIDLYSLSLEELVNISIVSATSKQKETAIQAPGIVSYITRDNIQQMGANNLLELLRRLPNIEVPSLFLFRNNMVSIRGQHSDTTDTRVLILLNGRPMRETYNGGVNSPIYDGFPLSSIEMIEVIRGPGSILHGSGAFSGVINIITRQAEEPLRVDAVVSYGSFNTKVLDASGAKQFADWSLSAGVKLFEMDGWDYAARGSLGSPDSAEYGQQLAAGTFKIAYNNLELEYFEGNNKNDTLGTDPVWPIDEADLLRRFVNLQYKVQFNDNWYSEWNITHNQFEATTEGPLNEVGSNDSLIEFTTFGKMFTYFDLIVGGSRERQSWFRDNTPEDDGVIYINRYYAELAYKPFENLRFALGGQYNQSANTDSNTSPRAAFTYQFLDNWGVKLLYGEAFRAAVAIEREADIPGLFAGNRNLKPETIKTLDNQFFYYSETVFAAINFYLSEEESTIVLDFNQMPISYVNAGKTKYRGVELEFKWQIATNFNTEGSYSYQRNEGENGNHNVKLTPQHMAKVGFNYQIHNGIALGLFDSYFSAYGERKTAVVINPENEAYHHLSANLSFNLNKLAGYNANNESIITIYGDNLLESDTQYAPDVARSDLNTLPVRSGRAIYMRYEIKL